MFVLERAVSASGQGVKRSETSECFRPRSPRWGEREKRENEHKIISVETISNFLFLRGQCR